MSYNILRKLESGREGVATLLALGASYQQFGSARPDHSFTGDQNEVTRTLDSVLNAE